MGEAGRGWKREGGDGGEEGRLVEVLDVSMNV